MRNPRSDIGVKRPRTIIILRPPETIGDSVRIPLTRGYSAWVDLGDRDLVACHNWQVRTFKKNPALLYAETRGGAGTLMLHRLLMAPGPGLEADHIDGDGLNNRRSNLRVATRHQNGCNTGMFATNTSGVKGVCFDRSRGKFNATIVANGVTYNLGRFATLEEAANARAAVVERFHGAFASTRCSSSSGGGAE